MDHAALIKQLGIALPMMGAKKLIALKDGLQFSIARAPKGGNKLVIKLNTNDLYDIEFWNVRGAKFSKVAAQANVFCGDLHGVLQNMTGFDTRL